MSLHAPQPRRPLSRSSIATTLTQMSSPPSSWSSGKPRSTTTSATEWSDQGTEMPVSRAQDDAREYHDKFVEGWSDEPPLIDFDEEPVYPVDRTGRESRDEGSHEIPERPADRLKMLLRQMEAEVEETKLQQEAVRAVSPDRKVRSHWRDGRRHVLGRSEHSDEEEPGTGHSQTQRHQPEEHDREDDEESPPTPPLRITNPYLSRRPVERSALAPSQRMTSRAAVLRNSISKSPPMPSSPPSSSKSPLETFIATHPSPPAENTPLEASTSRSPLRSNSDAPSPGSLRKGKQRASFETARPVHTSRTVVSPPRRSHTPRKWSIELPPDDSAVFAEEAASLEARGDALDLSDSSDEPPWVDEPEESTVEEESRISPIRNRRVQSSFRSSFREEREQTIQQREEERSRDNRSHGRLSRVLKQPTPSPQQLTSRAVQDESSLPALPEPSVEEEEEEERIDKMSSRQASLFRSPSRSASRSTLSVARDVTVNVSKDVSSRSFSGTRSLLRHSLSPGVGKVQRGDASTRGSVQFSTPIKESTALPVATPHPPGRWYSPSQTQRTSGRPVASTSTRDEQGEDEGDISIHHLRVSPGKKASPKRVTDVVQPKVEEQVEDSSFLGRIPGLSRMVAKRHPLPLPSTTVQEAKHALAQAAQTSTSAKERVEKTQIQFLEALAAAQHVKEGAVAVVKQGWGWGNWAWWIGVEMLLVWGVFRVTLDYATSARHLASIDPFSLSTNAFALSVPLPTALSPFIIPHRGSANFFDLLERLDLWRRLDDLGLLSNPAVVAEGVRMLGRVPT